MKTAEQEWKEYSKLVLPPDAGRVQSQETRRAFYSGMLVATLASREIATSGEVDDAVKKLDAFYREVEDALGMMVWNWKVPEPPVRPS